MYFILLVTAIEILVIGTIATFNGMPAQEVLLVASIAGLVGAIASTLVVVLAEVGWRALCWWEKRS